VISTKFRKRGRRQCHFEIKAGITNGELEFYESAMVAIRHPHETVWPKYVEVKWEIFADLDYDDEGRCIITRQHVSVAPEKAVEQVMRVVKEGKVRSINGTDVPTKVDTICVHSDTPDSVAVARAVREAIEPYLA